MNLTFRSLIALSVIALSSTPNVCFSASDERTALVIGNSAYENAPLKNPANDATDMATMLKRLGFKVTLKTNATRRTMQSSINAFGKKISNGGVGLFYYAGHGLQVHGHNYLIPVDAHIESESDVDYEAVDAGRVLGKMEDAGNGFNIIILDACRNNPFARSFRSGTSGLAKMDAPSGSILAFSTAPGSIAADGTGRNGLYTSKLLKHMATPNLKIETIFKEVRIEVARDSGKKQTPWESSSLMGDFYFSSDKKGSSQPVRAISVEKKQGPQNLNAEEEMWEVVKTSPVIDDYTMFLDQYPKSRFIGAAKLKIQQLKRKQNAQRMTTPVAPKVAIIGADAAPPPTSIMVGALDASPSGREGFQSRQTLAIFPWKPAKQYWNWVVLKAIGYTLKETGLFNLAFSYYDVDQEYQVHQGLRVRKITEKEILSAGGITYMDELWSKPSFFAELEPRVDLITKIGNQLKVDAVLICNLNIQAVDPPNGGVSMYLIRVPGGEKFYTKGYTTAFDEKGINMSTRLGKELFSKLSQ